MNIWLKRIILNLQGLNFNGFPQKNGSSVIPPTWRSYAKVRKLARKGLLAGVRSVRFLF